MDLGLKDRVALVAAASKGIGFATALELAREGARVFLCSRDEARASEAAQKIHNETGATVAGVAADVTDEQAAERFVNVARQQAGRIDILVTNAGGPRTTTFADADLDMFRKAFELNALSAIRLAKLVLPGMAAQKWGRIINITSVSVKQPIDGLLLSNTIRAGLTGWAKTVSTEVAADNVTVNNVAPGYTLTERQDELAQAQGRALGKAKEEMIAMWASQVPMRRLASAGEIGAAVAFLASERASCITGVTLQVDGGWVRSLFCMKLETRSAKPVTRFLLIMSARICGPLISVTRPGMEWRRFKSLATGQAPMPLLPERPRRGSCGRLRRFAFVSLVNKKGRLSSAQPPKRRKKQSVSGTEMFANYSSPLT
jgi:3-oxoacyl-[acyl-carrier protein] reductase